MKIFFSPGYWIGGFGLGENMDERPALLNAVTVSHKLEPSVFPWTWSNPILILCTSKQKMSSFIFWFLISNTHINVQDILQEEKPRLISGLGLPGNRSTIVIINWWSYQFVVGTSRQLWFECFVWIFFQK